jgi:hypothetical protein
VIDPTDEMVKAFERHFFTCFRDEDVRDALAAVLAVVDRDYGTGPCSAVLPDLHDSEFGTWCELRHGHAGDHEAGLTRWKERP